MHPAISERLLLSPREAGALIGRSAHTLAQWRCRGVGPAFVRQGAGPRPRVGYTRKALVQWLERHGVEPHPGGDL